MITPADLQLCVDLRWGYVKFPVALEPKIDGFRCLVTVDEVGVVRAFSRSGTEWPAVAAALQSALSKWPGCWYDGEIQIKGSWAATNAAKNRGWKFDPDDLCFIVFDGTGLWNIPNTFRIGSELNPVVSRVYQTFATERATVAKWYRKFVKAGYEGIVVKTLDPYTPGRSGNWQRLKPCMTEDVEQADGSIVEMFRGEIVRIRDDKPNKETVYEIQC